MVTQIVNSMDKWRRDQKKDYNKDQGDLKKQLNRMKMQRDKQKSRIVFLEVGVEISKEKLAQKEETIKDPLERVKTLEAQQRARFAHFKIKSSLEASISSFQLEYKVVKEEETMEQPHGRKERNEPTNSSSVIGKCKGLL